jgi:Zn-dependent protease
MASNITQNLIYFLPSLIIAISVHEMVHSLIAYRLGDNTSKDRNRLSLNPLHHIDPFTTIALPLLMIISNLPPLIAAKPVPVDSDNLKGQEFGMALVAIAGPLCNLLMAIATGLILRLVVVSEEAIIRPSYLLNFALYFMSINISLFVFNMIPLPPLDGSRLLYAFSPEPLQKLLKTIESFGFVGVMILILFVMNGPFGTILGKINKSIFDLILF